jgi:hypothetical protein
MLFVGLNTLSTWTVFKQQHGLFLYPAGPAGLINMLLSIFAFTQPGSTMLPIAILVTIVLYSTSESHCSEYITTCTAIKILASLHITKAQQVRE